MIRIVFQRLTSRLIVMQYLAVPTLTEWVAGVEQALGDQPVPGGIDILLDRRGFNDPPSTQGIHATADFLERHKARIRRFAAVVDGPANYGMGRMLELLSDRTSVRFRVFHTYPEAMEWLGGTSDRGRTEP